MVRSRGRLSADEGYDIALQLVDGLEAIHDQAIVHRDLKTSNVMIDRRGTALLMDFGIAKLWEGEAGTALTASGQIIGTPQYMSPEQAKGEPLDPRSDIYAMGVILFELFTGALPIDADNFAAMVYKKLFEPLQLDTAAAAHLPESLKPVIRKALATAAADRYASTRELRAALLEARAQTPVVDPDAQTRSLHVRARVATPVPRPTSQLSLQLADDGVTLAVVALISLIVRTALPSSDRPRARGPADRRRALATVSFLRPVSQRLSLPPRDRRCRFNRRRRSPPRHRLLRIEGRSVVRTVMQRRVSHWHEPRRPRRISSGPPVSTSRRATGRPPPHAPVWACCTTAGSGVTPDTAQAAEYLRARLHARRHGRMQQPGHGVSVRIDWFPRPRESGRRFTSAPARMVKWMAARISGCCCWTRLARRRKRKRARGSCSRRHAQEASHARAGSSPGSS